MIQAADTYSGGTAAADSILDRVLYRLLTPLARLCLKHGISFAIAADKLKQAFVQEAASLRPGATGHGLVSRIATATGINRREVTRLTKAVTPERVAKQPRAAEVIALWATSPLYRAADGRPLALPRQGEPPSFESLARKITRDIHPRSLLDELERLGFVQKTEDDRLVLVRSDFVPEGDAEQMLSFLSDNVGDHLDAAVSNVLGKEPAHLEQAVFADELSEESVNRLRPLLAARWQELRSSMVPVLADMIEADRKVGRPQNQRIRLGIYSYAEPYTPSSCEKEQQ
jgi:hypothetical protein